ncbi:MAG: hypothetical protein BGO69_10655 [Bacteroidetes bacterium 46-16]|nr:MAG: hypothetical protein BGO69_10655 [Bacteroidetes bacterium 46-16]
MKRNHVVNLVATAVFIVLPVGCFVKHLFEDKEELRKKQLFLDQRREFQINGNDTTVYYKLTGDELKDLIRYPHPDRLNIK